MEQNFFGNIFEKKRMKLREQDRVQKALERRFSRRLNLRESEIHFELENISPGGTLLVSKIPK